jgi:hypothetical protein
LQSFAFFFLQIFMFGGGGRQLFALPRLFHGKRLALAMGYIINKFTALFIVRVTNPVMGHCVLSWSCVEPKVHEVIHAACYLPSSNPILQCPVSFQYAERTFLLHQNDT